MDGQDFVDWLGAQLDQHGWTHGDLARETGLSPSVIHRWRNGVVRPNVENARTLASVFHVPLLEVLIIADVITEDEARHVAPSKGPRDLSDEQLIRELKRRLQAQSST